MIGLRRPALSLVVALTLAACGGGSASSNSPSGSSASSEAPASQAATEGPGGSSQGPAETPSGGGGGGTAGDACDLATPEEIGAIVGESGMTIGLNTPGDVAYCVYAKADGGGYGATSWMKQGGSGAFGIWKSGAGVQGIDGVADGAAWDPSSATLVVLNGDAVVTITAGDSSVDEAKRLTWSKAIAEIAVGRM